MLLKRIVSASAICLIIIASFILPYSAVPVYAETETQEEFYEIGSDSKSLAAAIQAYINARNVWFLSDNSKAFIAWVTNEIEKDQADLAILAHNIFSTINRINPVDGTILKFQYKTNAISILNKYFNEWRNKYGLSTEEGKTTRIYSGKVFTDLDGNSCLIYDIDNSVLSNTDKCANDLAEFGTNLKYNLGSLNSDATVIFNLDSKHTGLTYNLNYVNGNYSSNDYQFINENNTGTNVLSSLYCKNTTRNVVINDGGFSVLHYRYDDKYYFVKIRRFQNMDINNGYEDFYKKYNNTLSWNRIYELSGNYPSSNIDIHTPSYPQEIPDDDVTIEPKDKTTKKPFSINDSFNDYSKVINNYIDNSVTNNTTSIVNPTDEPDEPEPEPEPNLPDEDGIWSEPNDEGGYNYHWDAPSGLPDFNFSLPVQLERKFPFCMPFDLLAIFTIFNGEPETPTLEGQIHIGYGNWQYVWDLSKLNVDLHDFDSVMEKVRSVERLGFLIALTFLTMRLFSTAY